MSTIQGTSATNPLNNITSNALGDDSFSISSATRDATKGIHKSQFIGANDD
jgi:hypothetical protein